MSCTLVSDANSFMYTTVSWKELGLLLHKHTSVGLYLKRVISTLLSDQRDGSVALHKRTFVYHIFEASTFGRGGWGFWSFHIAKYSKY